jgi:5-formyltetrahydrofolate cyclo-ligase
MTKQELRTIYLTKRKELNEAEVAARSEAICDRLFSITDFGKMRVVHIFLPMRRNNEPNSWLIIDRLRRDYPEIKISVPRVKPGTGELDHIYLEKDSDFKDNIWGIPEISNGETTLLNDIDLVLVPLLAFDVAGNRVGYGKGFYDRFLGECGENTIRTGISLFEVVEQIDDIDEFDQALHYCITPFQVHAF